MAIEIRGRTRSLGPDRPQYNEWGRWGPYPMVGDDATIIARIEGMRVPFKREADGVWRKYEEDFDFEARIREE